MNKRWPLIGIVLVISISLLSGSLFGGTTGKIAGYVKDKATGEPLAGVNVVIVGTTMGASTDLDGHYFIINVPVGTYSLRASMIGYKQMTVENVKVIPDLTTTIDFKLEATVIPGQTVRVVAERPMIEKTATSTVRITTTEEIKAIPTETVQGIVRLQAGVSGTYHFRGGRSTELEVLVDGISMRDPLIGGLGMDEDGFNVPLDPDQFPTVTNIAVKDLIVLTGGFSAEYGEAMSGVINMVTKAGGPNYEGEIRYKASVGALNGTNDLAKSYHGVVPPYEKGKENVGKLQDRGEQLMEFGFGGPVPFVDNLRFYLAGKGRAQVDRNSGLIVHDPAGNNLGKDPHQQQLENSLNLKLTYNLSPSMKITLSGFRGMTEYELGGWSWRYNHAYIRRSSVMQLNLQTFIRWTHTLSPSTYYEVTLTYADLQNKRGRRKNEADRYRNWEFWKPYEFRGFIDKDHDNVIDYYTSREEGVQEFRGSTRNPYGLYNAFAAYGCDRTLGEDYSKYVGVDVDLSSQVDKHNLIKTGFEIKFHKVHRRYNSLPWNANPFEDNFTYKPVTLAAYIQNTMEFPGLVINPGIRLDYQDPNAKKRTNLFESRTEFFEFADAKPKYQLSPRIGVSFPVTDRVVFHLNYGWFTQFPPFQRLYMNITAPNLARGNQVVGNPDMEAQKSKQFEFGAGAQLTDYLALDVVTFYKDMYNMEGITFIPAVPNTYSMITEAEYGNVKGIEFTLTKRMSNYFAAKASYTLSVAKGTATSIRTNYELVTNGPPDPYSPTGREPRVYPQADYYLDFDRRHNASLIFDVAVPNDAGLQVYGIQPFENISLNLTTVYYTGRPYTREDYYGNQVGEYNGARHPWFTQTDLRLSKGFKLGALGSGFKDVELALFLDVTNLFNRTAATSVYARTGVADYDGTPVRPGDYSGPPWKEGDPPNSDGEIMYNDQSKWADFNKDGQIDADERYQAAVWRDIDSYRRCTNYQRPREVWAGIRITF